MAFNPEVATAHLTRRIIGAAIAVHRDLGPGLLESAYQACLEYEYSHRALRFKRQLVLPVHYRSVLVNCGYRLDFLVEDLVVVEVKSVERLVPIHEAQMIRSIASTIVFSWVGGCRFGLTQRERAR